MLLQAILGLAPNATEGELRVVRPQLPYWLEEVEVRGLRVGDGSVDLLYEMQQGQTRVSVVSSQGLKVSIEEAWPQDRPPRA